MEFDQIEDFLKTTLPAAGEILKSYFGKKDLKSSAKSDIDFVTEADTACDRFLIEKIKEAFPGHQILTEETADEFKGKISSTEKLWVVDPLDGTTNFSCRDPHFAISAGLVSFGKSVLAATYAPMSDEFYFARADQEGTLCNGKRVEISQVEDLKKSQIRTDWAWDTKKAPFIAEAHRRVQTGICRMLHIKGSAVLDLSRLAHGDYPGYFHFGLKPWDIAAGILLVEKAGGKVVNPYGEPVDLEDPRLIAGNPSIVDQLVKIIDYKNVESDFGAPRISRECPTDPEMITYFQTSEEKPALLKNHIENCFYCKQRAENAK